MSLRSALALCAIAALACAPAAAAGRGMYFGAAEDAAKSVDPLVAKAKMDLAQLAGFDAVRLTAIWRPGDTELLGDQLTELENAAAAANLNGIRVILAVYHYGSKTTPLSAGDRRGFADFVGSIARKLPSVEDFIIGNEPNLNRFWMPQFNGNGSSASPAAYLGLLALTYDELKDVSWDIRVVGGSVSPRGNDNPKGKRHTHSPYRFIRELGVAYRRSGRPRPVMDAFAFHPYGDNSSQPPEFQHAAGVKRIGISEYDRLIELLAEAFDGTAQPGSELPVVYDEYGVEARIPSGKSRLYTGREPKTIKPVDEATQARFYRSALRFAACQHTVEGMLLFHVSDESDLDRWQSGIFYADDTPKPSFRLVRDTVLELREATASDRRSGAVSAGVACPGLARPAPAGPRTGR
jgi:hypothetical protein